MGDAMKGARVTQGLVMSQHMLRAQLLWPDRGSAPLQQNGVAHRHTGSKGSATATGHAQKAADLAGPKWAGEQCSAQAPATHAQQMQQAQLSVHPQLPAHSSCHSSADHQPRLFGVEHRHVHAPAASRRLFFKQLAQLAAARPRNKLQRRLRRCRTTRERPRAAGRRMQLRKRPTVPAAAAAAADALPLLLLLAACRWCCCCRC